MTNEQTAELKDLGWCILELMGHRRLAGQLREELVGGSVMLRIDVAKADGNMTQFYGGSAVYCITPTTEAVARAFAATLTGGPVMRYEIDQKTLDYYTHNNREIELDDEDEPPF